MPTYDYRCLSSGEVVSVRHSMSEKLHTWGEVCAASGRELGGIAPEAAVERLANGGQVVSSGGLKERAPMPACGGGGCGHCH